MLYQMVPIVIAAMIFFAALGQTLLPNRLNDAEDGWFTLLFAPVVGCGFWLTLTVAAGMITTYSKSLLAASFLIAAAFIFHRRRKLIFNLSLNEALLLLIMFITAAGVAYAIIPVEIDGSLYFNQNAYDHVRCSIADAISRNGLPPRSPFLADNGVPVPLAYYFGWNALTAQLCIIFGTQQLFAEITTAFITTFVSVMLLAAITYHFSGRKNSVLWLAALAIFNPNTAEFITSHLPKAVNNIIFTEVYSGFWGFLSNCIWSPHHTLAAAFITADVFLFSAMLRKRDFSFDYPLIIGVIGAGSFFCSVYAGIFGAIFFGLSLFVFWLTNVNARRLLNSRLLPTFLCAAIALAISGPYVKYLSDFPPAQPPLAFGIPPSYQYSGAISAAYAFIHFFFITLPLRWGVIYLLGLYSLFVGFSFSKQSRDKDWLTPLFFKGLTLTSLFAVFICHSTFYTNDFGWRSVMPAYNVLLIFSAVFADSSAVKMLSHKGLARSAKSTAVVTILIIYCAAVAPEVWNTVLHDKVTAKPEIHQSFTEAVKGWEEVRNLTGKQELVLCNPVGFQDMNIINIIKDEEGNSCSVNIFQLLYAGRDTPISDLVFAKCYSEFYDEQKLKSRYKKVYRIFNGKVTSKDGDYLANELCVKALLITQRDKLWGATDTLLNRYTIVSDKKNYKIMLKK